MKLVIVGLALLTAACAAVPPRPFAGADPSNPDAGVTASTYRSTTVGYQSQRPVQPATWREQNERVAPKRKQ